MPLRWCLLVAAFASEWIVRFDHYTTDEAHAEAVSQVLGRRWRRRSPRYARMPTDFCVVELDDTSGLQWIRRHVPGVVDVTAQTRFTSSLKTANFTYNKWRRSFGFSSRLMDRGRHLLDDDPERQADIKRYGAVVAPGKIAKGIGGANASVAIFDTGLSPNHPHFPREPVERINWTSEHTVADRLGHGTFVASLVGGTSVECPGFAPLANMHVHKVFTNDQISFTSWFLDAFNYILWRGQVRVVNLSVGGPDFADAPFADKVREVAAAGITIVSAIGNDGPTWGTLNSPADMVEVVGVGGTEAKAPETVAPFSSRGKSLAEGVGRWKPDVTAPATGVLGAVVGPSKNCRAMHGTSVASPSVAGLATLLASASKHVNPAMIKQCLIETAKPSNILPMYVQGAGAVDVSAVDCARDYEPRVTLFPSSLDLNECPMFAPYCEQPLFVSASVAVNVTVLNGRGVSFRVADVSWRGSDALEVDTETDTWFWPWIGALGVRIRVVKEADGLEQGTLTIAVETPAAATTCGGTEAFDRVLIDLPVTVKVVPRPPRHKRLLWDATHDVGYPPAFAARDSLRQQADLLDWNGDEPSTNFRSMFLHLRRQGYFIDVLTEKFCFDAADYGALVLVDSEDVFSPAELDKIQADVKDGLGLLIVADWHSPQLLDEAKFFDDNTQVEWTPTVGGANVPALNAVLKPYGIAFGDVVFDGRLPPPFGDACLFDAGNAVVAAPSGAYVHRAKLRARHSHSRRRRDKTSTPLEHVVVFAASGTVAVFGDSGCLDDAHHSGGYCWPLLDAALDWILYAKRNASLLVEQLPAHYQARGSHAADQGPLPLLAKYSTRLATKRRTSLCGEDDTSTFRPTSRRGR